MNEIRFYKEFGPLGYLATYSSHGFMKDGIYWKTSEHYYQAQKFSDSSVRQLIINAPTPKEASNIGRNRMYTLREDWELVKQRIMFDAVYYKFKQNEQILKKLLETGEKFGWSVKIETQGSGGVEFALTDEDINAADCVLIASDVAVSGTERFKGKPMVKVPVATAIKSPEHLLRKIEEKLGAMKK